MFQVTSPPRMFAIVSLLMIVAMVIGISLLQAPFFRQSMIDREAAVVRDMVNALALEHEVHAADFQHNGSSSASQRFDSSFGILKKLQGTARIKLFNPDLVIVWSDQASLVGSRHTAHQAHLMRAMQGEIQALFNPARFKVDSILARNDRVLCAGV